MKLVKLLFVVCLKKWLKWFLFMFSLVVRLVIEIGLVRLLVMWFIMLLIWLVCVLFVGLCLFCICMLESSW